MSKELQEQLAHMLSSLLDTANTATAWTKGQLPLLIAEKVRFGVIENALLVIVAAVVFGFAMKLAVAGWREQKEAPDYADDGMPQVVFGGIVAVVSGLFMLLSVRDALLAYFAPRLYIIEWLTALAKS